ncbi:hypothetical protein SAMN05216525_1238 [Bradyrhizobium sp. Gha]|nr:hypothetical protein SAMN05216525_1238 [Bradyrhizobium sp. Gha]
MQLNHRINLYPVGPFTLTTIPHSSEEGSKEDGTHLS